MIRLSLNLKVYVHTGVTDMRCGFDRLMSKVTNELKVSPIAGGVYMFLSRRRDRVKLLYWDGDGLALWYKRLEAGIFRVERSDGYEEITGIDLEELLRGVEFKRIKFRNHAKNLVQVS